MSQTHPRAVPPAGAMATILAPVDVDAAVDAATMLTALHARAERQFAAYEAADGGPAGQLRAVRAIGTALATQVTLEDELLYRALRAQTSRYDRDIQQQLEQDHLLDMLMVELGDMIPTDPRYDAKVRVLIQALRQHARDAEALLVPQLRRRLDPAQREPLGRRLLERIGQLERRPRPGW